MEEELVDLVDDNGKQVRVAVPRKEAESLNGEKFHISIISCVIFNSSGEVLIHKRSAGKIFEGCISHVYGAIVSGEKQEDTVRRESMEEVGAQIVKMHRVGSGINIKYYFQNSFVAIVDGDLDETNREFDWVEFIPVQTLRNHHKNGKFKFTPNFFIDLDAALIKLESIE